MQVQGDDLQVRNKAHELLPFLRLSSFLPFSVGSSVPFVLHIVDSALLFLLVQSFVFVQA